MIGAIIGDMVGAPYEFDENNIKSKKFPFFDKKSEPTDDSIMTCAIAQACLIADNDKEKFRAACIEQMHLMGEKYPYPMGGYGSMFRVWLDTPIEEKQPFGSYGNGSAMRVSPVGWYYNTLEEVLEFAKISAEVTHNHEEGIKGAQAVAAAVFMARTGSTKLQIKNFISETFGYNLSFRLDDIRPTYRMDATCQGSVPQAIRAFLEGETFEDCVRCAVSIGGDSDTIACITGAIAGAFYNIPMLTKLRALHKMVMPPFTTLYSIYHEFMHKVERDR